MARKSKYESHVKPKLALIAGWARDGYTEKQIAERLGIAYSTFNDYKLKYPELTETILTSKEIADYKVEQVLYDLALNGEFKAIAFWLRNRNPKKWNRKESPDVELMALKEKELALKIALLEQQVNGDQVEEYEDDGFIEAMNTAAGDVWGDSDG